MDVYSHEEVSRNEVTWGCVAILEQKARSAFAPMPAHQSVVPPPPAGPASAEAGFTRLLRIGGALLVLAIAVWFLYDRFVNFSSSRAVLGGAPFTLRAPIDGTLEAVERLAGAVLDRGAIFGHVRNDRFDGSRLSELSAAVAVLQAELGGIERRLAGIASQTATARQTGGAFLQARLEQLRARLMESEANLAAARATMAEAETAARRGEMLLRGGFASRAQIGIYRRDLTVARAALRAASERRAALMAEQAGATAGIFASDSSNDRSVSQQSEDRLQLQQLELEALHVERSGRLAGLRQQLEQETRRVSQQREATLYIPAKGRLVRLSAQPGEYLRQGQDIASFIECGRPIVTAEVDERTFRALRLSQVAHFTAAGEREEHLGRILQLLPPMMAPTETRERFVVVVGLAGDRLSHACEIGRIGMLRF